MTNDRTPPSQAPRNATGAAALFQQAMAAHRAGRLAEAETMYREVLRQVPNQVEPLHLYGALQAQRGRFAKAADLFRRAIAVAPKNPTFHALFGKAMLCLERPAEALPAYDRAIVLKPDFAEALGERAMVLIRLDRLEDAVRDFDAALRHQPGRLDAQYNRATALLQLGRLEEALSGFDRILQRQPDYAEAHNNRGTVLRRLHRPEEALAAFDRALQLRPGHLGTLTNRATALQDLGRLPEALAAEDEVLAIDPRLPDALYNRADTLRELKRHGEAAETLQRLLEIDPGYDYALGYLLNARLHGCDWSDEAALSTGIATAVGSGRKCATPFLMLMQSAAPADQQLCAQAYVADKYPAASVPLYRGERYERHKHAAGHGEREKIRLAYLSADFHNHATAYLMAELFETHDRDRFEITAISFGPPGDGLMRARLLRAFDDFQDVTAQSDVEVAQWLRRREIDIAIDLKGFTGSNRTGILAHRPAPLQVNYLGYPGTMGADYIDYIIADPRVIPPGDEHFYSEQVVRLPHSYQVNDRRRFIAAQIPARADAGLPESGFVFCCFNNAYKIRPAVFDIWMRLLGAVAGSVLWLLDDNAAAMRNLRDEASRRGVAPERLVFAPRLPQGMHLARHALADLFLDTLPYNAHTTASDALWADLPVLTCTGGTFAGRVGASLLTAIGLNELITTSLADYETRALQLATTPALLAEIKGRLKRQRDTASLFDTDRFRRHLEAGYETMWQRHQAGQKPLGFDVPAEDATRHNMI